VAPRVSPSQRIRDEIAELIAGATTGSLLDHFEQVARLAVRLVMQSALEAEITEFLGRDRYARGEREHAGSRNGYTSMSVKTTAGEVTLQRPKLRSTDQAFASRLLGKGVTRTNALESLVIAGFVRGLSVRDVEATLADALGPQATVSKSTVSRICEAIKEEFDAWKVRSLADIELEYLFADGSFFRMHPGAPAEPVLVAWGITAAGKPVLLGLEPGNAESTDAWAGFFGGLKARGLGDPLLVISDGGAGLIGAIELCFADSLRQRCLVHRARNLLAKVPAHAQATIKAEYWAIFDDPDATPGPAAVAEATRRAGAFAAKWRKLYPSAVACLQDDFQHLVTYLRFPAEHQGRIRHSNFIERTFGETRRRVKVIGRLPGERTCLSLVWAVLDRASRGWRGVQQTLGSIRLLADLRRELSDPVAINSEEVVQEAVTPAA
jgi:transposase-like protein